MCGPNKLECYTTIGWDGLPGMNTASLLGLFATYDENKVIMKDVLTQRDLVSK